MSNQNPGRKSRWAQPQTTSTTQPTQQQSNITKPPTTTAPLQNQQQQQSQTPTNIPPTTTPQQQPPFGTRPGGLAGLGGGLGGLSALSRLTTQSNQPTTQSTIPSTTQNTSIPKPLGGLGGLSSLSQLGKNNNTISSQSSIPTTQSLPSQQSQIPTTSIHSKDTIISALGVDLHSNQNQIIQSHDSISSVATIPTTSSASLSTTTSKQHEPTIRYVTADELSSFLPIFDDMGNMLDENGHILKVLTPAATTTTNKTTTKNKGKNDKQQLNDESIQKQQLEQKQHDEQLQIQQKQQEINDVSQEGVKRNKYDDIEFESTIAERFLKNNKNGQNTAQIGISTGPRRRNLIGGTVDLMKELIQRNYRILQDLKQQLKQRIKSDSTHDYEQYGTTIDFKNPIWGIHYYNEDNLEEYLDVLSRGGGIEQIYKHIQQYMHPFESLLQTLTNPLEISQLNEREIIQHLGVVEDVIIGVKGEIINQYNENVYKMENDNNNENNGQDQVKMENENNQNNTTTTESILPPTFNTQTDIEPCEWWDLKLLMTGTLCQDEFKSQLQQQVMNVQLNATTIPTNNNTTTMNDDVIDISHDDDIAAQLTFKRPHFPPFNINTSTFCVNNEQPNGILFSTYEYQDPKQQAKIDQMNEENVQGEKTTSKLHQSKQKWLFSKYLSQLAIPITMYIPKYLPPISTIQSKIDKDSTLTITLPLTRLELKKERKLRRQRIREEEQLLIKAGIIPKPPQKMRQITLYRQLIHYNAMGMATEFEQEVKKQIQQRIEKHINTNLDNMLTPTQRKEKRLKKIINEVDSIAKNELSLTTILYRVGTLNNPLIRKNIQLNAIQQRLTGVVIYIRDIINIVLIQGGPIGIKKFHKYITKRAIYENNGNIGAKIIDKNLQQQQQNNNNNNNNNNNDGLLINKQQDESNMNNNQNINNNFDDGPSLLDNYDVQQKLQTKNANNNNNNNNNDNDNKYQLMNLDDYIKTIDTTFGRSPHYSSVELWQGNTTQRSFDGFHHIKLENLYDLQQFFKHKNLEHYYHIITTHLQSISSSTTNTTGGTL